MKDLARKLRGALVAMFAACLILSVIPARALAAAFEAGAEAGAASGNSFATAASAVATIPQFNNWLVSVNAGLRLPPQDLAAISFQAGRALNAAPAGAVVRFDPAAGRIDVIPQAAPAVSAAAPAPAAAAPVSIDLKALPELRANVAQAGSGAQAWLEHVGRAQDPQALSDALNRYFDRSGVRAAASFDPIERTADVLAGSLPEGLRSQFDSAAGARQRAALQAWQDAPHRTYVLVNSYSFKDDGTPGLNYYDMRPLAQILWAADPKVDVIFVTAAPVDESMVRHVLQGHPHAEEIRRRVHFVALGDHGADFLSQKLLDPKHAGKLGEIRSLIDRIGAPAALYPYMGGPYEWRIAKELGIPDSVYAAHPSMIYWGTKSGGRKIFKSALSRYRGTTKVRVKLAEGAEDLYDAAAAGDALGELLVRQPELSRVAVKLNLGSSGEGNIFPSVAGWGAMGVEERHRALEAVLRAKPVGIADASGRVDSFADALGAEGAALEAFIPGIARAKFPSVQSEILPDGTVRLLSSHEQILVDGNTYVGARLGADNVYRKVIERAALEAARELAKKGIVGRFGTDFAAIPQENGTWDVYYIENNIRLTGTTHPLVAANGLTGGEYSGGILRDPRTGRESRYKSMDHDVRPNLAGLDVDGFLARFDRADASGLLFDADKHEGVLFHLVPAVKAAGNVGYTIIARTAERVEAVQRRLTEVLNELEIEHRLDGRVVPLHHFVARDRREGVEAEIGHGPQVKLFQAFLRRDGRDLYHTGADAGIVFHPHGYTVLGRDAAEIADYEARANRLLDAFAAEASSGRP